MEDYFNVNQKLSFLPLKYLLKPDAVSSLFANAKDGNKAESFNIEVNDTKTIEFRKVKV